MTLLLELRQTALHHACMDIYIHTHTYAYDPTLTVVMGKTYYFFNTDEAN